VVGRAQVAPPDAPAGAVAAPPPPAAEAPAPVPVPATPPAADPAAIAALSAKVEEADQNARVAARKLELLEEQLATKAKEAPA